MCGGYVCTNCGKCENSPQISLNRNSVSACAFCGHLFDSTGELPKRCPACDKPIFLPPGNRKSFISTELH